MFRLASSPQPVTRQYLQLLFWPDIPDESARRNLSHHLTHLRRSIPVPEVIVGSSDRLWIAPELLWCDVIQYRNLLLKSPREESDLRQAVDLYRGPFLEGFDLPGSAEFEQWCLMESMDLERMQLDALHSLIGRCTTRGEITAAIRYARRYLEIDELAEEIHRHLIELYAATGDRTAALKQYEICSAVLKRELGVDPCRETQRAYQAVLHRAHRFPEPGVRFKQQGLPGFDVPLVGREPAIRQLEEVILYKSSLPSQVVLISGEAGIGKTRLLAEFVHRCQDRVIVLTGTARRGERVIPYRLILDTLHGMIDKELGSESQAVGDFNFPSWLLTELGPVWVAEITRLLPELRTHLPKLPSPLPLDPESARVRLFDALSRLIRAYAESFGPVILCLDDLQWADASSLAWLVHLGSQLRIDRYPLWILAAYRSDEGQRVLDLRRSLSRSGALLEMSLRGLEEGAVSELLERIIGRRPGSEVLAHRLHKASGGNPFFLTETLRALIEGGEISEDLSSLVQLPLPQSVREAIAARLGRLNSRTRQVLEAGSVLGLYFTVELLRMTAGRSELETMDALEELLSRQLLIKIPGGFTFSHEITQRAVLEGIEASRCVLLHKRAGHAYERLQPEAAAVLAHHFEAGMEWRKAQHYHRLAAQQAGLLFAWQESEFHLGCSLEMLAKLDPDCEQQESQVLRGELLTERAHLRYLQGNQAGRDADLAELTTLAAASANEYLRLESLLHRVRYLNLDGHYLEAVSTAEQGLVLATDLGDSSAAGRMLAQIGFSDYFLGKPAEAFSALESARTLLENRNDPEMLGRIQHILGYVYFHLGEYQKALECQRAAYSCHEQISDHDRMARDLIDIGAMYKNMGLPQEARAYLQAGLDQARRIGTKPTEVYALAHWGSWNLFLGDYSAALDSYRQALDIEHRIASEHISTTAMAGIGLACYHLKDYAQSRHWLECALQRSRVIGHSRRTAETLVELAMVEIEDGCLVRAKELLDEGLSIARETQCGETIAAGLLVEARCLRMTGHPEEALKTAFEALHRLEHLHLPGCEMWVEIEIGMAALAAGEPASALNHTARAVTLVPQAPHDWIGCEQAHLAHARVLRTIGNFECAAEHEQAALGIILSKAEKIPDSVQRSRYVASFRASLPSNPWPTESRSQH